MAKLQPRNTHHQLWLLIVAATMLRLLFAQTGYGVDEAYAVATSRAFHLSIYDHPPMAWWLTAAMQMLTGSTEPWVIRLPFIALSAVATWQMHRLTSLLFGARAGLFAAIAFCTAPVLGVTTGTWVLPDGPLLVGLLGGAICVARLASDDKPDGRLWLAAGFWGGVAMLSKYHGVFFFVGVLLFVLSSKHQRHWLKSPWPYLGALVGLAVFTPVILWNIEHDFASFAFQSGRTGESHLNLLKPIMTLLGQALFLTPWIWLGLVAAAREASIAGADDSKRWLLLCLGLPLIILFTLIPAISSAPTLYHWAMPGYLFLFPLLGDFLARRYDTRPWWVGCWLVASGSVTATLISAVMFLWYAPVTTQRLGLPNDPLAEMRPLTEVKTYLETHGFAGRTDVVFAPTKWHLAGRFDVALKGEFLVTCFSYDAREYGIIVPLGGLMGKNFIIPVPLKKADEMRRTLSPYFAHLKRLDDLVIHQGGATTEVFAMFYGSRLKSLPAEE